MQQLRTRASPLLGLLLLLLLQGAPQVKYGSLSTTELQEVCKERGLSTKGQVRLRGRGYTCLFWGAQRGGG